MLAEILQDISNTSIVQALYKSATAQAEKMKHSIELLKEEVDFTMVQIRRQREELDIIF